MEKLIYSLIRNHKTNKYIVLDENNKVIEDFVINRYKIKDIDFNNFPSNVFDNIPLYLGKEYEVYNFDYIKFDYFFDKYYLHDLKRGLLIDINYTIFKKYYETKKEN